MKPFTVGPVQLREKIKKVRSQQILYFRTSEFSKLMLESDNLLKKFLNADSKDKSVYLTASGTAAMEATVINCFS